TIVVTFLSSVGRLLYVTAGELRSPQRSTSTCSPALLATPLQSGRCLLLQSACTSRWRHCARAWCLSHVRVSYVPPLWCDVMLRCLFALALVGSSPCCGTRMGAVSRVVSCPTLCSIYIIRRLTYRSNRFMV